MWVCETTTITTTSPAMATKEPREKKWCDKKNITKWNNQIIANPSLNQRNTRTHTHIPIWCENFAILFFSLLGLLFVIYSIGFFAVLFAYCLLWSCCCSCGYYYCQISICLFLHVTVDVSFFVRLLVSFSLFWFFFWNFLFDMMINRDLRAKLKSTAVQLYHASK